MLNRFKKKLMRKHYDDDYDGSGGDGDGAHHTVEAMHHTSNNWPSHRIMSII